MSRFFIQPEMVKGHTISVTGKEAHHILDVMRLKELDKVVTFDGTGREYIGFIKETRRRSLVIEIVETRSPLNRERCSITLMQAIPKKDKMDYLVEKATELGVAYIVPVITKRTVPVWDESKKKNNAARWLRIARTAAKQCGRTDVPEINGVVGLEQVIGKSGDYDLCIIAALSGTAINLKDALKDFKGGRIAVAIGPEGDFTESEVRMAEAANFKTVSLGKRVLRSDTAGLFALSILNYEFTN